VARRVFRFLVTGSLTTLVAYLIFMAAIWAGLGYRLANPIAWICTVGMGATLNRWFTWRSTTPWGVWMPLYLVGAVLQLTLSAVGYEFLIGYLALRPTPAFIFNTAFTATVSFLFMNFIAFRRAQTSGKDGRSAGMHEGSGTRRPGPGGARSS